MVVAPPGTGKTVLVAKRGVSTLVLVHRKPLLDQWVVQLSEFLGVPRKEIGVIGGGKRKDTGRIDVAMIQSLVRKGEVDDVVARYGHVVVHECHDVSASSFARPVRGEGALRPRPPRRRADATGTKPRIILLLNRASFTTAPLQR